MPIPRRFWKITAWATDDALVCTAYLLDQGLPLTDWTLLEGYGDITL